MKPRIRYFIKGIMLLSATVYRIPIANDDENDDGDEYM